MTELEQLRADLTTIRKAAEIAKRQGFHERTGNYDQVEGELKEKIADLEAQQEPDEVGKWKTAKDNVSVWLAFPQFEATGMQRVAYYVKHLEAKVAELDHELRCERIDGGKVRDDLKARIAEMEQHGRKVDQANHEHYKRLHDQIAIRDLKIEKLEGQEPYEKNLEKLAELTTILNAIPPACELARELVEKRIKSVKKEMQGNG